MGRRHRRDAGRLRPVPVIVTNDIAAAVIDAENAEMLAGTGVAPSYITGLLATTGILTRAYASATDTYALDTLDLAEADLRTGRRS